MREVLDSDKRDGLLASAIAITFVDLLLAVDPLVLGPGHCSSQSVTITTGTISIPPPWNPELPGQKKTPWPGLCGFHPLLNLPNSRADNWVTPSIGCRLPNW